MPNLTPKDLELLDELAEAGQVAMHVESGGDPQCWYCGSDHPTLRCTEFPGATGITGHGQLDITAARVVAREE